MIEARPTGLNGSSDGSVELRAAGEDASGEFRCSGCGYGVSVASTLPSCPMCGGGSWEPGPWTASARADARRNGRSFA